MRVYRRIRLVQIFEYRLLYYTIKPLNQCGHFLVRFLVDDERFFQIFIRLNVAERRENGLKTRPSSCRACRPPLTLSMSRISSSVAYGNFTRPANGRRALRRRVERANLPR